MSEPSTQSTFSDEDSGEESLLADRYQLLDLMGEGGMGKVFEAEHVLMKKKVAIKVLRRELTEDDEIVARFHREAQAAAALVHPNVCQATDFGQNEEGAFFLVMEYLEGETLQNTIEVYGQLETKRALHIARQIAAALAEAHAEGIVHRDLKPENVMLVDRHGDPDTVKIMDFGIARLIATAEEADDDSAANRLTRKGMVYGTPHYMSPEQVAGEDVDARTDIYALGVVLFEMLTGAPPFDADNIARVMGQHVTAPVPSLSDRCPNTAFSPALQQLVHRLLAKDADERPATATEVIREIEFIEQNPHPTQRPNAIEEATRSMGAITQQTGQKSWEFWKAIPSSEKWIITALSGLFFFVSFAVIGGFVLFFALSSTDDRQAQAVDQGQQSLLDDETIAAALDEAEAGDRSALEELLNTHEDDAHLRFLALEADLEADRPVELVEEAQLILELDGRYAHDPGLVDALIERFDSNSQGEAVRSLLAEHLSSTVRTGIAELARNANSSSTRDLAYEFLEEHQQLWRLEEWELAAAELRQASGCSAHREQIEKLAEIGDPRALPVLETYQNKSTRGCGRLGLSDCYGCIRGDLSDAVEALSDS